VIETISEIKKEGQGSGAGAVGGGVIGGVLGHQVGRGSGKDLATVLGAVGGAFAGNAIEKKAKTSSEYRIVVRFEDGSTRTYPSATVPTWRIGEKVKVINGVIQASG
jgi:outer membrane lipoprotein SlyB